MDETLSVNTQEVAEPVEITEESPATGVNEAEPAEQPQRDLSRDAAFAKMRREAEDARREAQEAKREAERHQQESVKWREALGKYDVKADNPSDALDSAEAYRTGRAVDEVRKERLANERLQTLESKTREYEKILAQKVYEEDLGAIKALYPDLKAKTVDDLGPDFMRLRAAGVDPVVAYGAVHSKEDLERKPVPPSTGSVKTTGTAESEFYSDDELNSLTDKQLNDPKTLEKAMRSLTRPKKKG